MVLIGLRFKLGTSYYALLSMLIVFVNLHILQNKKILLGHDTKEMLKLRPRLSEDLVIIALVYARSLMISAYLRDPSAI